MNKLILPALLLISFITAFCFYNKTSAIQGVTGFIYGEAVLTREQFEEFWKNDPSPEAQREIKSTVLLTEKTKTKAEIMTTGAQHNITLIQAAGDMSLALPGALMNGSFVSDRDSAGCVISRKTAEDLFGTRQAVGQTFVIESDVYSVRGVLDIDEGLCMIQGEPNTLYSEVRVNAPDIPVSSIVQLMAACIPGTYLRISEGGLYAGVARLAVWIPAWILTAVLLMAVRRRVKSTLVDMQENGKQTEWLNAAWSILFPIAVFASGCTLLLGTVHFSDDYVPGAWSDFAFWGELFTEKWKQIYEIMWQNPEYADRTAVIHIIFCIISSVVCAVSVWKLAKRIEQK